MVFIIEMARLACKKKLRGQATHTTCLRPSALQDPVPMTVIALVMFRLYNRGINVNFVSKQESFPSYPPPHYLLHTQIMKGSVKFLLCRLQTSDSEVCKTKPSSSFLYRYHRQCDRRDINFKIKSY